MDQTTVRQIEQLLGIRIARSSSVAGGDINEAFLIEDSGGSAYFLKAHHGKIASDLLQAEATGLAAIRASNTIAVPVVHHVQDNGDSAWLLLSYHKPQPATAQDWRLLGTRLAHLHRQHQDSYGFPSSNFIGTLPQLNTLHDDWLTFYREERLKPQFEMARSHFNTRDAEAIEQFYAVLPSILVEESPSLIHGDLWGGNYLISSDGPLLIDPAVCFGHREMDIAMSRLFGGFDEVFYESYNLEYPLLDGWQSRMAVYQLYYLLAHLNMFGSSYLGSVMRIVRSYI